MFLGELVAKLGVDTTGLKKASVEMQTFGARASSTFSRIQKSVFSLKGAFVSLGVGLSFSSMIKSAAEYESALIDMGKVTQQSFQEIDKQIKSLNASLGDRTELMKGYYQVISAGVTEPKKALETLTTASKLSKVAHVEQAETVKALTKLMTGYRDSLISTEDAASLLLKTEKLGQTSVGELVPVIGEVANISNLAGVKVEEMAGALALITQTAGSTAEATTQLKALMRSIIKPTDEMKEAFKEFGSVANAVKQLGLVEWLKRVKEAAGNAEGMAEMLGGRQESIIAFSALMADEFENLSKNITEMANRTGTLNKAWEEYQGTFNAVWGDFKAQFKNLIIEFAQKILPSLTKAIKFVNENFETMVKVVKTVAAAYVGLKIGKLILSFTNIATTVGTASVALKGFSTALTVMANPTTWPLVVGLGTLILLLQKFNSLSEEAKKQVRDTYSVLGAGKGFLSDIYGMVKPPTPGGYDETTWRNEQLAARASREVVESQEDIQAQIEEAKKKWEKVAEAAKKYEEELKTVGKTAKEVALIKLDEWLEEQRKELGIITPELQKLYDARKKEIMGPTKQETFTKGVTDFATYVKNTLVEAQRAIKQLGMSTKEAASVFQEEVLKKAQETINALIYSFNDPFMKQKFIKALEALGTQSGISLFGAIARQLKRLPEEVTKQTLPDVVTTSGSMDELLAKQLGLVPGAKEQIVFDFSKKTAETFAPITNSFREAMASLGPVGAEAGAEVGKNFNRQIVSEIKKAVEEAKKEIGSLASKVTITVDVKNRSLTNVMRGDL